ncbi:Uncharacterised protein [Chlamydia trachomatis]|nr:Uncharacterised protein [Chlamydia trachomatis]
MRCGSSIARFRENADPIRLSAADSEPPIARVADPTRSSVVWVATMDDVCGWVVIREIVGSRPVASFTPPAARPADARPRGPDWVRDERDEVFFARMIETLVSPAPLSTHATQAFS